MRGKAFPVFCLCVVLAVMAWSSIDPHDRLTWWLESVPAILAVILLTATYKWFRFTNLLYALIALHCCVLLIGGHYTYAHVPLGEWMKDWFGFTRNQYDRIGHLMQGFVPAMIGRELLLRNKVMKPGAWLFALLVLGCLGISALYEIIEWAAAATTGGAAEAFLGTQGDVWDTQKDMALAGIGAALALLLLGKWHNSILKGHSF